MEEILSKSTNARRRGLAVVATTALVAGASFAGAGTAYAALGDYKASDKPDVTQGLDAQAAGDVSYEFLNAFNTNDSLTFALPANECDTAAHIEDAISFSSAPTVTVTAVDSTPSNGQTANVPSYTVSLAATGGADPAADTQCNTVGVKNTVTVTFTQPASGDNTDDLVVKLGDVKYDVGSTAALGDVPVDLSGTGVLATAANAEADVANAHVVNKSFMFMPLLPRTRTRPARPSARLPTLSRARVPTSRPA